MGNMDFFTNQFLVAMPWMEEMHFHQTVTYICEHNDQGALGIVINRPMNVLLGDLLRQLSIEPTDSTNAQIPIFSGGPLQQERGFVIHEPHGQWDTTLQITEELGVTTSRDILSAIAHGEGPRKHFIALGYAGWDAGQLEREMADNAWLTTPADSHIIFDSPVEVRWRDAARLIGVDVARLSNDAGHA